MKETSVLDGKHIDFQNGVLYGVLQQVRNTSDLCYPELIKAWSCEIEPSQSKRVIPIVREYLSSSDPISLFHIKRFYKISGKNRLKVLLCSEMLFRTKENLLELIRERGNPELYASLRTLVLVEIPRFPPPTKDCARAWSQMYWPISWKGNPNHQYLKSVQFKVETELEMIRILIKFFKKSFRKDSEVNNVALISRATSDPYRQEILSTTCDDRNSNPLGHSIMKAIEEIASNQRKKTTTDNEEDSIYLCHNLFVYTIYEPCIMCSMALVHSRIGRIIYLEDAPMSGGLSSNYQLGDRNDLNWKNEIWKWIGKEQVDEVHLIATYKNSQSVINF